MSPRDHLFLHLMLAYLEIEVRNSTIPIVPALPEQEDIECVNEGQHCGHDECCVCGHK